MKFLCLGYFDREKMDARPKSEIEALMQQCQPYLETLYNTGQVIVDAGLDVKSTSLRRVNGKLMTTDGPFIETKELVGGTFILEAKDMNEAIQLASLHPTIKIAEGEQFGWSLEIRPIHLFKNFM
jgi:hypothetical protein